MTKPFLCICLLQLWYLLKSMYSFTTPNFQWHLPLWISIKVCSGFCSFCLIKNTVNVFKKLNTFFCFYKMLINAVAAPEKMLKKVVPKVLYIAMIDSLRPQFYPRMRQAGRNRKISDSHRKGYACPMCEKICFHLVLEDIYIHKLRD